MSFTKGINSPVIFTDVVRDEEIRISCDLYFTSTGFYYYYYGIASYSDFFDYFLYSGGPVVNIRILRTYWTSEGNVVPSINTSNRSSYVLIKAPKDGVIPPYKCNVVCDFFSNISDLGESCLKRAP